MLQYVATRRLGNSRQETAQSQPYLNLHLRLHAQDHLLHQCCGDLGDSARLSNQKSEPPGTRDQDAPCVVFCEGAL